MDGHIGHLHFIKHGKLNNNFFISMAFTTHRHSIIVQIRKIVCKCILSYLQINVKCDLGELELNETKYPDKYTHKIVSLYIVKLYNIKHLKHLKM